MRDGPFRNAGRSPEGPVSDGETPRERRTRRRSRFENPWSAGCLAAYRRGTYALPRRIRLHSPSFTSERRDVTLGLGHARRGPDAAATATTVQPRFHSASPFRCATDHKTGRDATQRDATDYRGAVAKLTFVERASRPRPKTLPSMRCPLPPATR